MRSSKPNVKKARKIRRRPDRGLINQQLRAESNLGAFRVPEVDRSHSTLLTQKNKFEDSATRLISSIVSRVR